MTFVVSLRGRSPPRAIARENWLPKPGPRHRPILHERTQKRCRFHHPDPGAALHPAPAAVLLAALAARRLPQPGGPGDPAVHVAPDPARAAHGAFGMAPRHRDHPGG